MQYMWEETQKSRKPQETHENTHRGEATNVVDVERLSVTQETSRNTWEYIRERSHTHVERVGSTSVGQESSKYTWEDIQERSHTQSGADPGFVERGGAAATASAAGTKIFGGSRLKTLYGISKGGGGAPCPPPPNPLVTMYVVLVGKDHSVYHQVATVIPALTIASKNGT